MTSRTSLDVVAALFATYMLFRHLPAARGLLRREDRSRPAAIVAAVNVVLAAAILAVAVKGLVGGLISR
jgi:hypothetical protein